MPTITELLPSYQTYLLAEKGCSQNTFKGYQGDLLIFEAWLEAENKTKDVTQMTHVDLRLFLAERYKEQSTATLARRISTFKSFWKFLTAKEIVEKNVTNYLRLPREKKTITNHYSVEDIFTLLETHTKEGPLGVRELAIWELGYGSGLRVSEMAGLDLQDLDLIEGWVTVLGKGNKERRVPVGERANQALRRWLLVRGELTVEDSGQALFLNYRGGRLTTRSMARLLKNHLIAAGLDPTLTPHGLRHSCASHMLVSGADVRGIQEMLGHESLATTQKYTHISNQELIEAYDKFHPHAKSNS